VLIINIENNKKISTVTWYLDSELEWVGRRLVMIEESDNFPYVKISIKKLLDNMRKLHQLDNLKKDIAHLYVQSGNVEKDVQKYTKNKFVKK